MGNSAGKVKFDIVSRLPPELILMIVGFLKLKHVLQCLLVCRVWHQIITHLDPYWKERAVVQAGLTWEAAKLSLHSFPSSWLFYVAARRYMTRLRKTRFQYARTGALKMEIENFQFVRIRCLQACAGIVVHMVRADREDRDGIELGVVVQRMSQDGSRVMVTDLYSVSLGQYSSLAWVYADSNSLLWVTRVGHGVWGGYWVGEKGQDSVSCCTLHPLINDGQAVKLGCCTKCQLVVAAYWGQNLAAMETVCMLQAVKLSVGCCREMMKPKALKIKHSHRVFLHRDSRVWLRATLVLSTSEEKEDGVCRNHCLVLQCDCCTVLHALGPGSSSGHCLHCNHGLQHRDTDKPNTYFRNTSSEVCLSSDEQLLGLVFNSSLVVCQVDTSGERGTSLVSQTHLKHKPTHPCSDIHLVAVGHICSLVYFRSENYPMDYRLHVVSNQTGYTLTELCRAEKLYNWNPPHADDLLPQFYLTSHEEDWLSDVQRSVPHSPAVAVYSRHGTVHAESVLTTKSASQSWREHWRCAVNFAFRH